MSIENESINSENLSKTANRHISGNYSEIAVIPGLEIRWNNEGGNFS